MNSLRLSLRSKGGAEAAPKATRGRWQRRGEHGREGQGRQGSVPKPASMDGQKSPQLARFGPGPKIATARAALQGSPYSFGERFVTDRRGARGQLLLLNCLDPPGSIYKAPPLHTPQTFQVSFPRQRFLASRERLPRNLGPAPVFFFKGLNCIQLPRARRQRFKLQSFTQGLLLLPLEGCK